LNSNLNNVIIRVFPIRPNPEGNQDVVVVLAKLGDGFLPVEAFLVPGINEKWFVNDCDNGMNQSYKFASLFNG